MKPRYILTAIACTAGLALLVSCKSPQPPQPPISATVITTLRIQILIDGIDRPAADVRIRLVGDEVGPWLTADAEGRVTIPRANANHLYRVDIETGGETSVIQHYFRTAAGLREQEHQFYVPARRRIVLNYALSERDQREYPHFSVEKRNESGDWETGRLESIESENGNAVVVVNLPGTYRVLIHEARMVVHYSSPVSLTSPSFASRAEVIRAPQASKDVRIKVITPAGRPAAGAVVRIASPLPGQDGLEYIADKEGFVSLGSVNVDLVKVAIEEENDFTIEKLMLPKSKPAVFELRQISR